MVSARRPASSMPEIEVRISGGIFLFSLTYWSNCCDHRAAQRLDLGGLVVGSPASTGVDVGDEVRRRCR